MTPDTADLILRSLDELRAEVKEGLRNLNTVVSSLDNRVRELELWRASQMTTDDVIKETVHRDHVERGMVLTRRQVNIALGSVVISALAFTGTVVTLIWTGTSGSFQF